MLQYELRRRERQRRHAAEWAWCGRVKNTALVRAQAAPITSAWLLMAVSRDGWRGGAHEISIKPWQASNAHITNNNTNNSSNKLTAYEPS